MDSLVGAIARVEESSDTEVLALRLEAAIFELRRERRFRERSQQILSLAIFATFVFFAIVGTLAVWRFDSKQFAERLELGVREAAPSVLDHAHGAGKYAARALLKEASRQMPRIEDRLSARVTQESQILEKSVKEYLGGAMPGLAARYVDVNLRATLVQAVPELNREGGIDKLLARIRSPATKRAQDNISGDLRPHLLTLNQLQEALRRMQLEAKGPRSPEAVSQEIMLAAFDVLRLRMAQGETLDFDHPFSDREPTR